MHSLFLFAFILPLLEVPSVEHPRSEPIVLELWPEGVPGAPAVIPEEKWTGASGDAHVANVFVPSISVHLPEEGKGTGCAVIICPGGGYGLLAIDKEGHDIARWFTERGVAGVVLKYRMPRPEGHVFGHEAPLADCRKAFEITRARSKEWGIDPARVGVMGFSAGGHLAASASVQMIQAPPAFSVLIYPVVSLLPDVTHSGSGKNLLGENPSRELIRRFSSELHVTSKTPRAFLVHAADDWVPVANSRIYAAALEEAKVPYELHVFSKGGHGYGMRKPEEPVGKWPSLLEAWMGVEGFLEGESLRDEVEPEPVDLDVANDDEDRVFDYLPFFASSFELESSREALRAFDVSIGEAYARYESDRLERRIDERWQEAGEDYVRKKGDETLLLRQTLDLEYRRVSKKGSDVEYAKQVHEAIKALDDEEEPKFTCLDSSIEEKRGEPLLSFEGHEYLFVDDLMTWEQAKEHCVRLGGHLVCTETKEELDFIHERQLQELLPNGSPASHVWLGAFNLNRAQEWAWISEAPIAKGLWSEPAGGSGSVGRLASGATDRPGFYSHDRGVKYPFYCEFGRSLPHGWSFEGNKVNKAVSQFAERLKEARSKLASEKSQMEQKMRKSGRSFRLTVDKAAEKAKVSLKKALKEAYKGNLISEKARIESALWALSEPDLIPDANPFPVITPEGARRMGHSTYLLIEEHREFHEAQRLCEALGGRLAQFRTTHQEHFIHKEVFKGVNSKAWFGVNAARGDGKWVCPDGSEFIWDKARLGVECSRTPEDYQGYLREERSGVMAAHYGLIWTDMPPGMKGVRGIGKDDVVWCLCPGNPGAPCYYVCEWVYPVRQ